MIYSDFAQPTVSTTADTAGTTATIIYNGAARRTMAVWGTCVRATLTAAQGLKAYALFTGDAVPSPVPNLPIGQWSSGGLAPQGAHDANPTALPVDWSAPSIGTVTIDVRNATSTVAPLAQVGLIYSDGEVLPQNSLFGSEWPWMLRGIPKLYITATPTSVTGTTETSIGTLTVPPNYTSCVGLTTLHVANGVIVTAEEHAGTCRYTNTGSTSGQFDPAQKWPYFGQLSAGLGAIIDAPGSYLPLMWHPLAFNNTQNASIVSLVTNRTAVTNATSNQVFGAFR